jgi:hypothetical protein
MKAEDRYAFRMDGNFMIRVTCSHCGEVRDEHALSNAYPWGDLCPACIQVTKWMAEEEGD